MEIVQNEKTDIYIYMQGVSCNATRDLFPTYSHLTEKSLKQKLNGTRCTVGISKKEFQKLFP